MIGTAMSSLCARSSDACPPRLKMPTLYPVLPRLRVGIGSRRAEHRSAHALPLLTNLGSAAVPTPPRSSFHWI